MWGGSTLSPMNVSSLIARFKENGDAQVEGYKKFEYVRETNNAVIIRRENGNEVRIPKGTLKKAIEAVQNEPQVYNEGPTKLRKYGITHITSPVWAILHVVNLKEFLD